MIRAIRNRYFARSLAGQVAPRRLPARGARRGPPCRCRPAWPSRRAASVSSVAGLTVANVAAVRRRDLAPADEQAVALLDRDDVARLGRRRVLPGDRLAVAEPPRARGGRTGPRDGSVGAHRGIMASVEAGSGRAVGRVSAYVIVISM